MDLLDADKSARRLKKAADIDSSTHGSRNVGDVLDSAPVLYFDVTAVVQAYQEMRTHQKKVRKVLKAIKDAGELVDWYDLDML